MTDLRTAAQQALEAMELVVVDVKTTPTAYEAQRQAIATLRAALAEPVQEPVAWNWMLDGLPYGRACYGDPPDADLAERAATAGRTVRLLYTAPPQRKQAEPLNLRDPAVRKRLATQWGYVPAAQAEPVGEILPNWSTEQERIVGTWAYLNDLGTNLPVGTKLYTAPPQRKLVPLTEEEIMHIGMTHQSLRQVVRAVERAHGIKE